MIYPEAYYAAHKEASTPEELGRIGFALIGRGDELSPPLTGAERLLVQTIQRCNKWHTEKREEIKEGWRDRQRKHRAKAAADVTDVTDVTRDGCDIGCHAHLSIYPSTNLPTNLPKESTNRSVTVPVASGSNGNGNGTGSLKMEVMPGGVSEAKRLASEFAKAARVDQGAFFAPEFDAITICAAVTGDFKSLKRWRQLVIDKGEDAVRTEVFTFWREISAGEDVSNRGATLNKRLGNLPDAKGAEA